MKMETNKKDQLIGLCDICGQSRLVSKLGMKFARDHDHSNEKWRGQLCGKCNIGLSNFQDDPVRLKRAAEYLSYWRSVHNDPTDTDCNFQEWRE
jgi:hypothetical protein